MNRKSIFRFAWALTILLALTLGCKIADEVGSGVNEAITVATQIQGAATSVDIGGVSTQLGGIITQVDIGGITTQMGGIVTQIDIGGLTTQIGSMSTDIGGLLDEGTPGPVNTPGGFPVDIPLMTGSLSDMSGDPKHLAYTTDADSSAVVNFYQTEMKKRNWIQQPPGAATQEGETDLVFQNQNRRVRIKITEDFFFGTQVDITVEA